MAYSMPRVAAAQTQWHWAALLVLVALCTYLNVPLRAGGRILVPSYPTLVLMPLILLAVRHDISRADIAFVAKVAFLLLLSIAFSPGYAHIPAKLFGLVQWCVSLTVAILIVRLMRHMRVDMLERALLVLWTLIVVGAVLEVLGISHDASDAFRTWAYGGTFTLYESDLRDIALVGRVRPKVFSVEPSHVTKIFTASINAWLLVRVRWTKAVVVGAATLGMLLLMGSPMLLASAAITLVILMFNERAKLGVRVLMVAALLMTMFSVGAYYANAVYSKMQERVARIGEAETGSHKGQEDSEAKRLTYPYLTLADTWRRWPVFGVGVGGDEVVTERNRLPLNRARVAIGNNAFAEIGIFLGIVGGSLFIALLLRQAQQTGVRRLGILSIIGVIFSQLMGGVVSLHYWGYIALLWGALVVADSWENVAASK